MGDTTAAIVWYAFHHHALDHCYADTCCRGIPVNPVDFLCNLDAFRETLPTIKLYACAINSAKAKTLELPSFPKS